MGRVRAPLPSPLFHDGEGVGLATQPFGARWRDARSPAAPPVPASFTFPSWLVWAKPDGTGASLFLLPILWV